MALLGLRLNRCSSPMAPSAWAEERAASQATDEEAPKERDASQAADAEAPKERDASHILHYLFANLVRASS